MVSEAAVLQQKVTHTLLTKSGNLDTENTLFPSLYWASSPISGVACSRVKSHNWASILHFHSLLTNSAVFKIHELLLRLG